MKLKWTEEAIIADAKRFTTRKEWEKSSIGAYSAAHKRGLMDAACAHMVKGFKKPTKWTEEKILTDAKRFTSRTEWQKNSGSAYSAALKINLVDLACAHMGTKYRSWSDEEIIADAKSFSTRKEWELKSASAYQIAHKRGLLEVSCAHMTPQRESWSKDAVLEDALKFSSRVEWKKNSKLSYQAAQRLGILDIASSHMKQFSRSWTDEEVIEDAKRFKTRKEWELNSTGYDICIKRKLTDVACAHMPVSYKASSADVIYIWRAVGEDFNGKQVYKIGLTSARVKDWRIKKCSRSSGFESDIVLFAEVSPGMAYSIEDEVLKIGTHPEYSGFDGCTEFRAFSEDELNEAISLINLRAACESSAQ